MIKQARICDKCGKLLEVIEAYNEPWEGEDLCKSCRRESQEVQTDKNGWIISDPEDEKVLKNILSKLAPYESQPVNGVGKEI